tara:strand:- start:3366 stop:3731 length:366 start_codon:yes stop_codon:yes gene_type:complete
MYNHLVNITYHKENDPEDRIYKKQLLDAFKLEDYDVEQIEKKMQYIHNLTKKYVDPLLDFIKDNCPYPFGNTKEDYVPILFAWEYFYLTHEIIKNVNKKNENEIANSVQMLKKEMIKNLKK